jgi:hypothetical protein
MGILLGMLFRLNEGCGCISILTDNFLQEKGREGGPNAKHPVTCTLDVAIHNHNPYDYHRQLFLSSKHPPNVVLSFSDPTVT